MVLVYGKKWRRNLILCGKHIKPNLFWPFKVLGFAILVVGLVMEMAGSFSAERLQSKENGILESTNAQLSLQVQQLSSTNLWFAGEMLGIAKQMKETTNSLATTSDLILKKVEKDVRSIVANSHIAAGKTISPDRTITPTQEETIVGILKPFVQNNPMMIRKVDILADWNDSESVRYLTRLADVLTKCGFDVRTMAQIGYGEDFSDRKAGGLHVFVKGSSPNPNCRQILMAFRIAQIVFDKPMLKTNETPDGILSIVVSHKPE